MADVALDHPVLIRRSPSRFWRYGRRLWRYWRRARSRGGREDQALALSPRLANDTGMMAHPGTLERWATAVLQHRS